MGYLVKLLVKVSKVLNFRMCLKSGFKIIPWNTARGFRLLGTSKFYQKFKKTFFKLYDIQVTEEKNKIIIDHRFIKLLVASILHLGNHLDILYRIGKDMEKTKGVLKETEILTRHVIKNINIL